MRWPTAPLFLALSALAACSALQQGPSLPPQAAAVAGSVPSDLLNPDVREDTLDATICSPGYTALVRPSTSFTNGVKAKLMREAGIDPRAASTLELDHRVSLSVGGSPRHLANLQLQSLEGKDGAKRKDRLERRLQSLVCARQLSLAQAQWDLYSDWQAAYRRYIPAP